MAIKDIYDNNLECLKLQFPDDPSIKNIEFGAGKGYYGKKFLPSCFSTDIQNGNLLHFTEIDGSEGDQECHYLDNDNCDFFNYNFSRQFEKIIICNPFGFGLKNKFESIDFFNRAGDLLVNDGKLIILGNVRNPWANYENLQKYINVNSLDPENKHKFIFHKPIDLKADSLERKDIEYFQSCLKVNTYPDQKLIIQKV